MTESHEPFKERMHPDELRFGDIRDAFQRDKGRIVHSAGFRRLQGKTQVMGVGEGDFHRTRLTHSLEVAQIGEGLLLSLRDRHKRNEAIADWLPSEASVAAACYAHDLGHPPYGHGGERALNECMASHKGFEGNAQTLRILVKLEKYRRFQGLNPTRRTVLGVLKYPVAYEHYEGVPKDRPPKCYYGLESAVVKWALKPFSSEEQQAFVELGGDGKPKHRSLDASLMECADDIAYAVHDLEDVVARRLVRQEALRERLDTIFHESTIGPAGKSISRDEFVDGLFKRGERKKVIGRLVHLFVSEARITTVPDFHHPLMRLRVDFDDGLRLFLKALKGITRELVTKRAEVQQLERRGQRIIKAIYEEMVSDPERLIPSESWDDLDPRDPKERRVCDYVAGMTDPYAEKIYRRLFTPGFGSSRDEL